MSEKLAGENAGSELPEKKVKDAKDGQELVFIGGHIPATLKEEFVVDGKSHFRSASQQVHKAISYYMDHVKKGLITD